MCDWIKIFCIFLDDIIKKNRNGPGNRRGRGRGGNAIQRRGGNNQRGGRGGRVGTNNNSYRGGGISRRGGGRNTFGQRNNNRGNRYENNQSNEMDRLYLFGWFSFRQQRGGRGNSISGFNRRNVGGDKPTATVNHLTNNYYPLIKKAAV